MYFIKFEKQAKIIAYETKKWITVNSWCMHDYCKLSWETDESKDLLTANIIP